MYEWVFGREQLKMRGKRVKESVGVIESQQKKR